MPWFNFLQKGVKGSKNTSLSKFHNMAYHFFYKKNCLTLFAITRCQTKTIRGVIQRERDSSNKKKENNHKKIINKFLYFSTSENIKAI